MESVKFQVLNETRNGSFSQTVLPVWEGILHPVFSRVKTPLLFRVWRQISNQVLGRLLDTPESITPTTRVGVFPLTK